LLLITPKSLITTFWLAILASIRSIGLFSAAINCETMLATSIDAFVAELVEDIATEKPLI
jgi:hypothetical protein